MVNLPDVAPVLTTRNLHLRAPEASDASTLLAIINQPDILYALNRREPRTMENVEKFLYNVPRGIALGIHYAFAIELAVTAEVIGLVELHDLNALAASGEITIWISADHRRHGFARETMAPVLEWGIHTLHLRKVVGVAKISNEASIRLMGAVGMIDQGVQDASTSEGPTRARVFSYPD